MSLETCKLVSLLPYLDNHGFTPLRVIIEKISENLLQKSW